MRISDWSSDVCSSDLRASRGPHRDRAGGRRGARPRPARRRRGQRQRARTRQARSGATSFLSCETLRLWLAPPLGGKSATMLSDRVIFLDGEAIVLDKQSGLPVDQTRDGSTRLDARKSVAWGQKG